MTEERGKEGKPKERKQEHAQQGGRARKAILALHAQQGERARKAILALYAQQGGRGRKAILALALRLFGLDIKAG